MKTLRERAVKHSVSGHTANKHSSDLNSSLTDSRASIVGFVIATTSEKKSSINIIPGCAEWQDLREVVWRGWERVEEAKWSDPGRECVWAQCEIQNLLFGESILMIEAEFTYMKSGVPFS